MKFLITLFLFCDVAYGAVPNCFPGESSADAMLPTLVSNDQGCAAVWFCDSGAGKWLRNWIVGDPSECVYGYANALAQLVLTHDQKVALWQSTFTVPGIPPSNEAAAALANAVPVPTKIPPSGLFTQDVKIYKITRPTNASLVFALVGTAPLNTPCDTSLRVGNYYRIDRMLVKFPKGVLMPDSTWADCHP